MDNATEYTAEQIEQARQEALRDIETARDWIDMMSMGLRQFSFFEPGTTEENKIATLIQMIDQFADHGGTQLLAATAIVMVSELDPRPLIDTSE